MLNALPEEERSHGTISNKIYYKYVKEGGNVVFTFFLIAVFIASEVRDLFYECDLLFCS